MSSISATELSDQLKEGKVCLVDVRSKDEFHSGHIPGAQCIPLDQLESNPGLTVPEGHSLVLACFSGRRSARAKEILEKKGFQQVLELGGGTSAWAKAGLPLNQARKAIPVMRQVQIIAGGTVLLSLALFALGFSWGLALAGFIGAGQVFAGVSGWCGMALALEKAPWNRLS
jgi:rhodanese-related sulfurtransferase